MCERVLIVDDADEPEWNAYLEAHADAVVRFLDHRGLVFLDAMRFGMTAESDDGWGAANVVRRDIAAHLLAARDALGVSALAIARQQGKRSPRSVYRIERAQKGRPQPRTVAAYLAALEALDPEEGPRVVEQASEKISSAVALEEAASRAAVAFSRADGRRRGVRVPMDPTA